MFLCKLIIYVIIYALSMYVTYFILNTVCFEFRRNRLAKQYLNKKRDSDLLRKELDEAIVSPFSNKLDISQALRDLKTYEQELSIIKAKHNKCCKYANQNDKLIL